MELVHEESFLIEESRGARRAIDRSRNRLCLRRVSTSINTMTLHYVACCLFVASFSNFRKKIAWNFPGNLFFFVFYISFTKFKDKYFSQHLSVSKVIRISHRDYLPWRHVFTCIFRSKKNEKKRKYDFLLVCFFFVFIRRINPRLCLDI